MNQYRNIFGTTRIPGATADTIRSSHPAKAKHIVVLISDQIYKVDVLDDAGGRVSVKTIENQLYAVGQNNSETKAQPPIGVLTAGHRDNWFQAYSKLKDLSPQNSANFEVINDALFAVALDDHSSNQNINVSHHQIFHNFDGHNRWFDKAITLVVASSGHAGVNGEHTPSDAVVPGRMMDYAVSRYIA